MSNYKYLNRARKISDGTFSYWITNGFADPTISAANAPSPASDYTDPVVVSREPSVVSGKLIKEDVSSQANGSNQNFTVSQNYESNSLRVYWNGQRQIQNNGFSETGANTFQTTFTVSSSGAIAIEYYPQ